MYNDIKLLSKEISNLYLVYFKDKRFFLYKRGTNNIFFLIPFQIYFYLKNSMFFFLSRYKNKTSFISHVNNFSFWLRVLNKTIKRKLIIKGLGFRCYFSEDKSQLIFKLGYSHLKRIDIPVKNHSITIEKNVLIIESSNSLKLGSFCNKIKNLRNMNVYKSKGIYQSNEFIKIKQIKKN
jgi:hypothetical protein